MCSWRNALIAAIRARTILKARRAPFRSQIETMQPSPAEGWYYARRTAQQQVTAQRFAANVAGAGGWTARLRYVGMTLFPRPSYMRERYQVRHPLLTPFSYVQRLYVGLASLWHRS